MLPLHPCCRRYRMAVYGAEDLQHLLDTNKQYVRSVVTRRIIHFASSPLALHLAAPSDVPAEAIQLMKHMTRDWDLWRSHRRVLGTFHLAAKGSKVCWWLQRVAVWRACNYALTEQCRAASTTTDCQLVGCQWPLSRP